MVPEPTLCNFHERAHLLDGLFIPGGDCAGELFQCPERHCAGSMGFRLSVAPPANCPRRIGAGHSCKRAVFSGIGSNQEKRIAASAPTIILTSKRCKNALAEARAFFHGYYSGAGYSELKSTSIC